MLKIKINHPAVAYVTCELDEKKLKGKRLSLKQTEFSAAPTDGTHTLCIKRSSIYSSRLAYINIFNIFLSMFDLRRGGAQNCDEDYFSQKISFKAEGESELVVDIFVEELWEGDFFAGRRLCAKHSQHPGVEIIKTSLDKMPQEYIKRWKFVHALSAIFLALAALAVLTAAALIDGFSWWMPVAAIVFIIHAAAHSVRTVKTRPLE